MVESGKHNIPLGILYTPHKKREKKMLFSKKKENFFKKKKSQNLGLRNIFEKKKFPNSWA